MGLMQLMSGPAKILVVNNANDPYQNIMDGSKYTAQLLHGNLEKTH